MSETSTPENQSPAPARSNPWNPLVSLGRYGRRTVPAAILLAVFAASVTLRFVTPRYRAVFLLEKYTFTLRPRPQQPLDLNKERALLFSGKVLEPILADPALRTVPSLSEPNAAEANLRNNLSMDLAGASTRLIVCYQDTDPEAAAAVCNAVVDSYLKHLHKEEVRTSNTYVRWLEPEIKHWESEVEQGRENVETLSFIGYQHQPDNQVDERLESDLTLAAQVQSQINETAFQLAVLNARFHEIEHRFETTSLPAPSLARVAGELKRDRDLRAAELEVLNNRYDELRRKVERFGGLNSGLRFAQQELAVASDVLNKLRTRVAKFQTESRQDGTIQVLAKAIPPRSPINWPLKRIAFFSGITFLSPLMVGFLLGFRRDVDTGRTTE